MGGGEIALLNLVGALDRSRYLPTVLLASDGPLVAKLRAAGIPTEVFPLGKELVDTQKDGLGVRSLLKITQIFDWIRYAVRIARYARKENIDLIHTNSLKSDVYGGVAGRLARIPVLWHVRDNIDGNYLPAAAAAAFRFLARTVPTGVVANSHSTLRVLAPSAKKPSGVVYSGMLERPVLETTTVSSEAPVVALIGRIAEWKGQHIFLRAAAEVLRSLPHARFWIVGAPLFGEFEYEKSLRLLAADLGITDRVEFLGFQGDIPNLLKGVTLVAHASCLGEPFGQVVVEGMAAGKPVVATDGGALPEVVVDGETGLLVPMGDAPAMAQAILAILNDPARGEAMGQAGRRRVQERFMIQHSMASLEKVYGEVLTKS
ncbi:glycosyl transferase [Capsulimonas corticalis]|uniref:Glycosyl transferase n=2 Tax=Capsulimonas corticalis TaxID=2219043 RepID=A0A402CNX3_9BACT|nr:glycosyl transferase [Capsulimonas corticalis]